MIIEKKLKEIMKEEAEQIIERAVFEVKEEGGSCQTLVLEGDPATTICLHAEREKYDLIIIGSRGLGVSKELILGSVSHKVSNLSSVPVMIVK